VVPHARVALVAWRLAWAAWAGAGVVCALSLALPVSTFPANNSWLRRFRTPEISDALTVAQTFKMTADGLQAIELYPAPNGLPLSGDIRLTLVDITTEGDPSVVRNAAVRAADLVREPSYRFAFAPIIDSVHRTYRLEMTATDSSSGVVARATRGDPYRSGTLLANGKTRWADLAFRASAPTSSLWHTLWTGRAPVSGRRSGRVVLVLLGASWMAMGVLFRALLSADDPES